MTVSRETYAQDVRFGVSRETNLRLLKYEISPQTRKQFQSQDTRFSMKQNWAVPQCTKYTRNGAIAEPVVAGSTERLVQNKKIHITKLTTVRLPFFTCE